MPAKKVEVRDVKTVLIETHIKAEDKGYEFVSVTDWINGDGVDVSISRRNEPETRLYLGMEEIRALRKALKIIFKEENR